MCIEMAIPCLPEYLDARMMQTFMTKKIKRKRKHGIKNCEETVLTHSAIWDDIDRIENNIF